MDETLREYDVMVNGSPTTMRLNEQDAARLGGTLVTEPALPATDEPTVETKARQPENKARAARDKNAT